MPAHVWYTQHAFNLWPVCTVPKPDGSLARLMPSSAIEAANSAVREIFTDSTIYEDSSTPCNKVTLKTVR